MHTVFCCAICVNFIIEHSMWLVDRIRIRKVVEAKVLCVFFKVKQLESIVFYLIRAKIVFLFPPLKLIINNFLVVHT